MNLLIGLRTPSGLELGVGPNFSVRGIISDDFTAMTSIVYAAGYSFRIDEVNIPINIAYSPNTSGARISALIGFNIQQYFDK